MKPSNNPNENTSFLQRWVYQPIFKKQRQIKRKIICFFIPPLKFFFFRKEMKAIAKERMQYKTHMLLLKNISPENLKENHKNKLKIIAINIAFQKKEKVLSESEALLKKNCQWRSLIINSIIKMLIYILIIYFSSFIVAILKPIIPAILETFSGMLLILSAFYIRSTLNNIISPIAFLKSFSFSALLTKFKKGFAQNQPQNNVKLDYEEEFKSLTQLNETFEKKVGSIIKKNKIPVDSVFKKPIYSAFLPELNLFEKFDKDKKKYIEIFNTINTFEKLLNDSFSTLLACLKTTADDMLVKYHAFICEKRYLFNKLGENNLKEQFDILEEIHLMSLIVADQKNLDLNPEIKEFLKNTSKKFILLKKIPEKIKKLKKEINSIEIETKNEFEKEYLNEMSESFINKIESLNPLADKIAHAKPEAAQKELVWNKIKSTHTVKFKNHIMIHLNKTNNSITSVLSKLSFTSFFQFIEKDVKEMIKKISLFSRDIKYYDLLNLHIDILLNQFKEIQNYKISDLKNEMMPFEQFKIQRALEMLEFFNTYYIKSKKIPCCDNFKEWLDIIIFATQNNDKIIFSPRFNTKDDFKKIFSSKAYDIKDWLFPTKKNKMAYLKNSEEEEKQNTHLLKNYFALNASSYTDPQDIKKTLETVLNTAYYFLRLEDCLEKQKNAFENNTEIKNSINTIKQLLNSLYGLSEIEENKKNRKIILCKHLYEKISHIAKLNIIQLKKQFRPSFFTKDIDESANRVNSGILEKIFFTLDRISTGQLDERLHDIYHIRLQLNQYHECYDRYCVDPYLFPFGAYKRNTAQYQKKYAEKIKNLEAFFKEHKTTTLSDKIINNKLDLLNEKCAHLQQLVVHATTTCQPISHKKHTWNSHIFSKNQSPLQIPTTDQVESKKPLQYGH